MVPELLIVMVLTPPLTRMPVAVAKLRWTVVVAAFGVVLVGVVNGPAPVARAVTFSVPLLVMEPVTGWAAVAAPVVVVTALETTMPCATAVAVPGALANAAT